MGNHVSSITQAEDRNSGLSKSWRENNFLIYTPVIAKINLFSDEQGLQKMYFSLYLC